VNEVFIVDEQKGEPIILGKKRLKPARGGLLYHQLTDTTCRCHRADPTHVSAFPEPASGELHALSKLNNSFGRFERPT
jgi:hypothetical protein